MLSLEIKWCGCVADTQLSIDVNVGCLDGDPVVLEILRAICSVGLQETSV
jgi:hypothetical protein